MIQEIRDGADTKALLEYVLAEGGVDRALQLEAAYRKQSEAALEQLPSFKGKDILQKILDKLATRKV